MCGCERQPAYSASLKPPQGAPLGLPEGVTWIGRGAFVASLRAQLLCSRRQACFTLSESGLRIECHGINALLFVVCHSKNVHGTEATPVTELFQLRKGEWVDLSDGDQFYFAGMECLLTVVIRQYHIAEISADVLPTPSQQVSEACAKDNEEGLIDNDEQVAEIARALQECGSSDPLFTNVAVSCANSLNASSPSDCPAFPGARELLAAPPMPSIRQTVCFPASGECQYESVGIGQQDSDSLRLDAYDCLPLVGASRLDVPTSLRCTTSEEVSAAAAAVDDDNRLNKFYQCRGENLVEEALPNNVVADLPEDGKCALNAQFPTDGEGCTPSCIRDDHLSIDPSLCSRDRAHGLEVDQGLRNVTCAVREHMEPEDENVNMSSETVDAQSNGDELLLSEPARVLGVDNVRECRSKMPIVDKVASGILLTFPVSRPADAIPVRVVVGENPEVSIRDFEGEKDVDVSIAAEAVSWPDGPVEGMESIIATVSGYEGIDRQNLVKLINKTGAAFTGQLSKANTHLVCWQFHGKKFDRAMKLHKPVINHQWFEDCLRAGERLSESPYKLRSGEEVGLLKWKETLPPLVLERDELSNGAINQHPIDRGASLSNTSDQEGQCAMRAVCASSDRTGLPGTSTQAALPIAKSGCTGGRKKSRKLVKLSIDQENLVRGNPTGHPTGEPYQRRAGQTVGASEEGFHDIGRNSDSSASHDAGQVHRVYRKRRKLANPILNPSTDDQGRAAVASLRGTDRSQSSAVPDREFTITNLSDGVDGGREGIGLQMPQLKSAPTKEGALADTNKGKNPECSQTSQHDREIACAICYESTKSPSEGLLACGHKFCYKCIFKWTVQEAVKGPKCPYCKASYDFITRQEVDSSGKFDETVVLVGKKNVGSSSGGQRTIVLDTVCIQCGNSDTESSLMRCGNCGIRAIHTFCMDPPAPPPWYCPACVQNQHRDSMRLAWNQFLPGPSSSAYDDVEVRPMTSNVRRRNAQPYTLRQPSQPVSAYRPTLHSELTQSMGPVRRTNIVGQHTLRTWLNNETSNEDV